MNSTDSSIVSDVQPVPVVEITPHNTRNHNAKPIPMMQNLRMRRLDRKD